MANSIQLLNWKRANSLIHFNHLIEFCTTQTDISTDRKNDRQTDRQKDSIWRACWPDAVNLFDISVNNLTCARIILTEKSWFDQRLNTFNKYMHWIITACVVRALLMMSSLQNDWCGELWGEMQEEKVGSYTVNMDAGVCFNVYTSDVLCQVHVYLCIIYIYIYIYIYIATMYVVFALICLWTYNLPFLGLFCVMYTKGRV